MRADRQMRSHFRCPCAHWCVPLTCHKFCWITPDIFTIRRCNSCHFSQLLPPRCPAGARRPAASTNQRFGFKKRDLRLLLLRLTHARRQHASVYSLARLFSFFLPHFSAFDANARQRSVGQRLSALRLLRLPGVDERRGGKTDDRSRQTATFG